MYFIAPKVDKSITAINWNVTSSNTVYNKYRALCGLWPLTTTWHGTPVKLLKLCKYQILNSEIQLKPGELLYDKRRHKLSVKCGDKEGYVSIEELKIPGRRPMTGKDFFNGFVFMKPTNERKFDSVL